MEMKSSTTIVVLALIEIGMQHESFGKRTSEFKCFLYFKPLPPRKGVYLMLGVGHSVGHIR